MKEMSLTDFARSGGTATMNKYGKTHFSKIGKKGAAKLKRTDPEYFQKLSAAGVAARLHKQAKLISKMTPRELEIVDQAIPSKSA